MLALAERLEDLDDAVTPAGMLRVVALLTDGASPLYGMTKCDALGDAIAADPRASSSRSRGRRAA